jgi:diaminopimelate epimerase
MRFTKMHGIGNDYIVINDIEEKVMDKSGLAKELCQRRFSIGSDGIIFVSGSKKEDIRFRMFNPDGSEAEMCGNGMRCFAKYVYENEIVKKKKFTVETLAGTIIPEVTVKNGYVVSVKVDMGAPILERNEIPMEGKPGKVLDEDFLLDGMKHKLSAVSMGNPHAVFFVDNVDKYHVGTIGPKIENHGLFPKRTNVEFVELVGPTKIKLRVWERGAGETLACGTGACASVVAASLLRKVKKNTKIEVELPGGTLGVTVVYERDKPIKVWLEGPAEIVYDGELLDLSPFE